MKASLKSAVDAYPRRSISRMEADYQWSVVPEHVQFVIWFKLGVHIYLGVKKLLINKVIGYLYLKMLK